MSDTWMTVSKRLKAIAFIRGNQEIRKLETECHMIWKKETPKPI